MTFNKKFLCCCKGKGHLPIFGLFYLLPFPFLHHWRNCRSYSPHHLPRSECLPVNKILLLDLDWPFIFFLIGSAVFLAHLRDFRSFVPNDLRFIATFYQWVFDLKTVHSSVKWWQISKCLAQIIWNCVTGIVTSTKKKR